MTLQLRADHSLIVDARVELSAPAPIYLEYGNEAVGWLRTPTTGASASHQQPILRMREALRYAVRAFAIGESGCPTAVTTAEIVTGRIPSQLRGFTIEQIGQSSFPLALMDWSFIVSTDSAGRVIERSRALAALDHEGSMVWYYRLPPRVPASQTSLSINRLSNGNWLYLSNKFGFEEITPDVRSVRRFRVVRAGTYPHHDFVELPDGRVLFLGLETRIVQDAASVEARVVRSDVLQSLDLETGAVESIWSAFDALDLTDRPAHWLFQKAGEGEEDVTHANSVSLGPRGNVIISMRHLDQIISLSPDFKTVEWRLGGPGSSFAFQDPSDRFYGQHTASELPGNRVLLFDNGNFRPEADYSRALELELDFRTMSARKVWEYRHQPDLWSTKNSNAIRLPNGNTLVNFGTMEAPDEPAVLIEALPDGTAGWVQSLKLKNDRTTRYRAYPLTSLAGEVSVQPTPFRDDR